MSAPRPALAAAVARFRLATPRASLAGTIGERLGKGVGASMDFADFRDYVPGDDPRRLDWRAYARTDRLQVRLYREEVAPALDVLVDPSASMATTPAKERAARDLAAAFVAWGPDAGARPRTYLLGGGVLAEGSEPAFDAPAPTLELPLVPLRQRGLRVVVSDFLTPDDPAAFLRRAAAGAADLCVVQLLDPWEAAPTPEGAVQLVDVESGARREIRLGPAAVKSYAERLARLRDAVATASRGVGARYAFVVADEPAAMCGGPLLAAGITEPR